MDAHDPSSAPLPSKDASSRSNVWPSPILEPGKNCWRLERAERIAWLIDGEQYFPAAKEALLNARHSVLLLAWDFAADARLDPRISEPEEPDRIGDLLEFIVRRRPELQVRVLVWSKATLLALTRRRIPGLQAIRMHRGPVRYELDNQHPPLATHHQKLLVIDDALAFCGGFDFAGNRWDTRRHLPDDPRRKNPAGLPAKPHHDIMLMVDGKAAAALGDLARKRWLDATGETLEPIPAGADPWPKSVEPHIRNADVGIARTAGAWRGRPEVQEIERLYFDAIASARDCIYLESQYLASPELGDALRRRLQEAEGPEIIIVTPKRSPALPEQLAMDSARTRIAASLQQADRFGRFRLYASLTDGKEVIVHSKMMIVDDRLMRVGSANLNRRSMGTDTECDLAVEAGPHDAEIRRAVLHFRSSLLADHLGVDPDVVARTLAEEKSVIATIERLNGTTYRSLAPFPPPRPGYRATFAHHILTDPRHPPSVPFRMPSTGQLAVAASILTLGAVLLMRWRSR